MHYRTPLIGVMESEWPSGHSIRNYGRLKYITLEWRSVKEMFDITFMIHNQLHPWLTIHIAPEYLDHNIMVSSQARSQSRKVCLAWNIIIILILLSIQFLQLLHIQWACSLQWDRHHRCCLHWVYIHQSNLCHSWVIQHLEADEIIMCFNDAMAYCDDIKPGTLYWWWTVKPILNKKKPCRKGKRFNATGLYQIMVRAFIIVTYVLFMLCMWWMQLNLYLHMQDLTVFVT